ncbi:MAG: AAA family ATPase, partial [Desulfobacterales bacterium]|nr:AAA family ATPase [Desulfobacterales bacterium]
MKNQSISEESGYLEYFSLKHNPFPVAPDDENFYISEHIEEILVEIVHGILSRKGFMVLTGDIGLGKTTISRRIIGILEEKGVETSLVFQTAYQDAALLREINRDFGFKSDSLDLGDQLGSLNDFLLKQTQSGKNCAIVIDDAQNLNQKSLEMVRMISNLEADQQKLVQILLIGQPELLETLNSKELRQLKSRIIVRKEAQPLSVTELKNYIIFKLNLAGNNGTTTLKKNALRRLHHFSRGNLRLSNILMDRCLCVAFLYNTRKINRQIVNEAFKDLQPPRPVPVKKKVVACLAVVLLMVLCGGFLYIGQPHSPLSAAPEVGQHKIAAPVQPPSDQLLAARAAPDQPVVKKTVPKTPAGSDTIPAPVSAFMDVHGLSWFTAEFLQALLTDQVAGVGAAIFEKTGYQLVQFQNVPVDISGQHDILAYPSPDDGREKFYLFWRPKLRVPVFYYSYQGTEIRGLQEMLAKFDLYNDTIDGNVGKNLMKAVV